MRGDLPIKTTRRRFFLGECFQFRYKSSQIGPSGLPAAVANLSFNFTNIRELGFKLIDCIKNKSFISSVRLRQFSFDARAEVMQIDFNFIGKTHDLLT